MKESHRLTSLRQRAAEKLGGSSSSRAAPVGQWASYGDAMTVLFRLASSPSTAGDARALLHEIQVHQVELDLQQEEILRSQIELETALKRQAMLVERAPVGYMTIDARTVLCEINQAGAGLLGVPSSELLGCPLANFLRPRSVEALQVLLNQTREGLAPQTCELELMPIAGMDRSVQAAVDQDITPGHFLLVLMICCARSSLPAMAHS
jgi:PAS domain-containing protein